MDYHTARTYLLSKPEAVEDYPFGPQAAVYKINRKMFATLAEQDGQPHMNLKCDPEEALALRDIFPSVIPGYHMNKRHWNTVILGREIPVGEVERMIDRSYGLVVKGLPAAQRKQLELTYGPQQLYR